MHLLHVMLHPELLPADVHRGATEAMRLGLAGVVIAPVWVNRVATMLRGSGVQVWAAVSFPNGTSKPTVKAIEATSCIKDGADAIWVVPHFASVIRADFDALKMELLEINRAARATRRDVAIYVVIGLTAIATADVLQMRVVLPAVCRATRESGCDGVVTDSSSLNSGIAVPSLIEDLRPFADGLSIIAHGGIDDAAQAESMLAAGANLVASERAIELAIQ